MAIAVASFLFRFIENQAGQCGGYLIFAAPVSRMFDLKK